MGGYALISGGAPSHETAGGCTTGSGTNDAGLWIFTRQQTRNVTLVTEVRGIADAKGFDLSVLKVVQQPAGCDATVGPELATFVRVGVVCSKWCASARSDAVFSFLRKPSCSTFLGSFSLLVRFVPDALLFEAGSFVLRLKT